MSAGNLIFIHNEENRQLVLDKVQEMDLGAYRIKFEKVRDVRTELQNNSLHKYCELLAEALNDAGYEIKKVMSRKPESDIPWAKESVKDLLWREIQKAVIDKESTVDANKLEYSEVYEVLNRFTATNFGISVPWPSKNNL